MQLLFKTNQRAQAIDWTEEFVSIIAATIRHTNPSDR
jgi:hypothetical protein